MIGNDVLEIKKASLLSYADLALILGTTHKTVYNWSHRETKNINASDISEAILLRMKQLVDNNPSEEVKLLFYKVKCRIMSDGLIEGLTVLLNHKISKIKG